MLARILVPVDGSRASSRAVEVALALAAGGRSELIFCNAIDYAAAISQCAVPYGVSDATPLMQALDDAAHGVLGDAKGLAERAGVLAFTVVVDGPSADSIVTYAKGHEIDAIVMGTRGTGGVERFFLGSTADGVLRAAEVPTFVVHPAPDNAPVPSFKRILVAADDSEPSAAAAAFAVALAAREAGSLVFCSVVETAELGDKSREYGYDPAPLVAKAHAERQVVLDRALALAQSYSPAAAGGRALVAEGVIVEGSIVEQILATAERYDVDAIAIGTHGRRGLERLFLGSVAEGVVRRSPVPVVVTRR